jgi:hypothetical protein
VNRIVTKSYEIIDPRPIAAQAKYTYFLPHAVELDAIESGDLVKLAFSAIPASEKWGGERMWVRVTSLDREMLEGTLESQPDDMPQLDAGALVAAPRTHLLDIIFENIDRRALPFFEPRREYWERCMVDEAILHQGLSVHYLYRETPDLAGEHDKYADSGWRIRGNMRNTSAEELSNRKAVYVALGAVLNRDDSWLHLIDEPIGSSFERNFETGRYIHQ